jgi:hypothetical protein
MAASVPTKDTPERGEPALKADREIKEEETAAEEYEELGREEVPLKPLSPTLSPSPLRSFSRIMQTLRTAEDLSIGETCMPSTFETVDDGEGEEVMEDEFRAFE